jgi:hypothetical protein
VTDDNYLETRDAVLAHTKIAERMLLDGQDVDLGGRLGADLAVYEYAKSVDDMTIMDRYADLTYDSSKDYYGPIDGFSIADYFSVYIQGDATLRTLYGLATNDENTRVRADDAVGEITNDILFNGVDPILALGIEGADLISVTAGGVFALSLLNPIPGDEVLAAPFGVLSLGAGITALGLRTFRNLYNPSPKNRSDLLNSYFYIVIPLFIGISGNYITSSNMSSSRNLIGDLLTTVDFISSYINHVK